MTAEETDALAREYQQGREGMRRDVRNALGEWKHIVQKPRDAEEIERLIAFQHGYRAAILDFESVPLHG